MKSKANVNKAIQNNIIDLSSQKYVIKEIDSTHRKYYSSQISNDEKYLAYGGEKVIKIYDLQQDKIIKEIKLYYPVIVCQFTSDSSLLFLGSNSFVLEFNVNKGFKFNQKFYLHQDYVSNMITIKNQFILTGSCDQNKIIKTSTKKQKQLFKLFRQSNKIYALDYNDIDDIIISGVVKIRAFSQKSIKKI